MGVARWRKVTGWILFGFAVLAVVLIVDTALSHTSSGGSGTASVSQSALASTATQVAAPVAAPSPSPTGLCLTNACIASGMEKSVTCVVNYSDGQQWRGYATLLLATKEVAFEPETELR